VDQKGPLTHFVSGVWADICGSTIWVPMDVVKQRLQIQRNGQQQIYTGSLNALITICKEEGIRGLYKGLLPGIATYGPFVGFYFIFYERSKLIFSHLLKKRVEDLPMLAHLISGSLSGGLAAALTCPLDVIKTRLQVQRTVTINKYKNAFDAAYRIITEEGFQAFTKGLLARVLWIAPGCAITIASYEYFKREILQFLLYKNVIK